MKVFSQLEKAQIENLTADPTGTGLVPARLWYRTDTKKFKVYDGTAVQEFVDLASAQTLVTKTLTAPIINNGTITGADVDGGTASNTQRITLPKNTKANLDGLTRKQATLVYASDTNKVYADDGTYLQEVGSGVGGLDTLHTEDFELPNAFATGNAASPDAAGTGALDGTLSDDTTTQINGIQSLKYVMGASSTNDFFVNGEDILVQEKHINNYLGFNFHYKYDGADNDIRFFVLDQNDAELSSTVLYLKASDTSVRFSDAVYIPSGVTAIRYGFQVIVGNSGKILLVDDLEITSNPFTYKNLNETQYLSWQAADTTITGTTKFRLASVATIVNAGSGIIDVTDDVSNAAFKFTATRDCVVEINHSADWNATDSVLYIYKNGITVADSIARSTKTSSLDHTAVSSSVKLSIGDFFYLGNVTSGSYRKVGNTSFLNITATATSEHVVTPATSNVNSVSLSGNDGRVITLNSEDIPFTGSGTGWTSGADNAANFYTVQNSGSVIHIKTSIKFTTAGTRGVALYKNSVFYKYLGELVTQVLHTGSYVSKKGEFLKGDALSIRADNAAGTLSNDPITHYLNIVEFGDAKMLAAIPTAVVESYEFNTHAGHGSINNKIPYYTNSVKTDNGRLVTVSNSPTLGMSVTVLEECEMNISTSMGTLSAAGSGSIGISKNSTQLTTSINAITVSDKKAVSTFNGSVSDNSLSTSVSLKLLPGDVIRPHSSGVVPTTASHSLFNITVRKLGTLG